MQVAVTTKRGKESITMARIRLGMSMKDFAAASGVSYAAISKIESGKVSTIRPLSAEKISRALGVEFDDMFEFVQKEG